MRRLLVSALFLSRVAIAATIQTTTSVSAAAPSTPTFNKDVLPILQKNCQECHRPGAKVTVLRVPNYKFDWQVGYELAEPLDLLKGTKLRTVSHYDNSTGNKFNPDPTKNVRDGAQSWDEMNVSFVGVLIDAKTNPTRTFGAGRGAPQ